MMMKCEYCGAMMDSADRECPNCGAVNSNMVRAAEGTPKTIEELKLWYTAHNLPPEETTRFFIGRDYKGARAFGIYKENGRCVVYKNKADGSRAIRYSGTDEAYAVNELYLKIKSEILSQREHNISRASAPRGRRSTRTATSKGMIKVLAPMASAGMPMLLVIILSLIGSSIILGCLATAAIYLAIYLIWKWFGKFPAIAGWQYRLREKPIWKSIFQKKTKILIFVIVAVLFSSMIYNARKPNYYHSSSGNMYCVYDHSYFIYNNGDWNYAGECDEPESAWLSGTGGSYDSGNYIDFEDSSYYSDNYSVDWSSDWGSYDSDYSWDSGSSWDSGWSSSSWDSDW